MINKDKNKSVARVLIPSLGGEEVVTTRDGKNLTDPYGSGLLCSQPEVFLPPVLNNEAIKVTDLETDNHVDYPSNLQDGPASQVFF